MSVESDLRCLIAMVADLRTQIKKSSSASLLPVVDFIVDNFDRPNNSVISSYWPAGSGALLVSNRFVYSGLVTQTISGLSPVAYSANQARYSVIGGDTYGFNYPAIVSSPTTLQASPNIAEWSADSYGLSYAANTSAALMYAAQLSGTPVIEVDFELPALVGPLSIGGNNMLVSTLIAAGASMMDAGGISDVSVRVMSTPIGGDGSTGYTPGNYSSLSTGQLAVTGVRVVSNNIAVSGTNTLRFENPSAGVFTAKLNGTLVQTVTAFSAVAPRRVGLCVFQLQLASIIGGWSAYFSPYGITAFRAWNAAMPQPPASQSGHGTYINGVATYTDKYHSTVSNSVVYNPLA